MSGNWRKEHGEDFEVPGIIDFMVKQGILEDVSWHNDAMPRFQIADPDDEERGVTIWVDHPLVSLREHEEGKRYLVQAGDFMGDTENDRETDDLEEALTLALGQSEKFFKDKKYKPYYPGIVKEWLKTVR